MCVKSSTVYISHVVTVQLIDIWAFGGWLIGGLFVYLYVQESQHVLNWAVKKTPVIWTNERIKFIMAY